MATGRMPLHPGGSRSQKDYRSQKAEGEPAIPIGRVSSLTTYPSIHQDIVGTHVSLGDYSSQKVLRRVCQGNLRCSSLASRDSICLLVFSAVSGVCSVRCESNAM
uniref:Uncharacterized protein n=1 Tax=Mus musculus TaxID=10090 RepID=Q3V0P6_MOUSE|nr:unnamed protein product [Mus musculus]